MTAAATMPVSAAPRGSLWSRFLESRFVAVGAIVAVIIVVWYIGAIFLNAPFQRFLDGNAGVETGTWEFIQRTWSQERPVLPSPHQVAADIWTTVFATAPTSKRSLLYHTWVTLSATLLGFGLGAILGILLAVLIVHMRSLDKSLMPWIISSQTIPILAIAPLVIVILATVRITGLLPKAIIASYLSFFPVTVGMVKGLRSPEPINLDLMRTYNATSWQVFWKLRWPSALPFLFVSMKVAIAASLVGAIVGELPTGAVAGLGARLLTGSYYGQTVQIWSALIAASVTAALLVMVVGWVERLALRRMGARP